MQRPFFAVLGGMGTLATESFVRLVNKASRAHSDQEYLDYLVFNDASVPDRTAFILGKSQEDPFPALADDITKATVAGASFIVLTCNTAHYFYDRFQALTPVPIFHMPRRAVSRMSSLYPADRRSRVGFMATEGSRKAGVYRKEIEAAGYTYVEPGEDLQGQVNDLIYQDVKGSGKLDEGRYLAAMQAFLNPHGPYRCDVVLLGCTELSVLNEAFPQPDLPLIDAQAVLVEDTVAAARALRR